MHGHKWGMPDPCFAVGNMNHKQNNLHAIATTAPSQVSEIHNQCIFYIAGMEREEHIYILISTLYCNWTA